MGVGVVCVFVLFSFLQERDMKLGIFPHPH